MSKRAMTADSRSPGHQHHHPRRHSQAQLESNSGRTGDPDQEIEQQIQDEIDKIRRQNDEKRRSQHRHRRHFKAQLELSHSGFGVQAQRKVHDDTDETRRQNDEKRRSQHHRRRSKSKLEISNLGLGGAKIQEIKRKIQDEMDETRRQKDETRRNDLAEIVRRTFEDSKQTGEVIMKQHSANLGDKGIPLVTEQLETFKDVAVAKLSICNHGIGPLGAQELAMALQLTPLQHLNLSNNSLESSGAEMLASALCQVPSLQTLILSDNRIGPSFPTGLCQCSSLTDLHLQWNLMTDLDTTIGLHPALKNLELAGNPFVGNAKNFLTMDTESVLKQMLDGVLSKANEKCEAVGKANADGRLVLSPIYELGVTLPERWNGTPQVLANMLRVHTCLKTLNGLHEWAIPPLAPSDTWDLSGRLLNPIYECVFVGNRLRQPNTITTLMLNNTVLHGQAALALAECVRQNVQLTALHMRHCKWDDGFAAVANAVAANKVLTSLNELALPESEVAWNLRGCLQDGVEMYFVARVIIERKATLVALDLRENDFKPGEASRLTGAIHQAQALTFLNGLYLHQEETTWDLRKKILDGRIFNHDRESKMFHSVSSAQPGGFSGLGGELPKRQTIGAMPFELRFLTDSALRHPGIVELQLAENGLGDAGMEELSSFLVAAGRTLQVLHLNNNRIGREGGEALGKTLGLMRTIQNLRLNDNPLGPLGVEAVIAGLGTGQTIHSLYLNNVQMGPILPSNLSTLKSLQILSACENGLETLNADLCKMGQLHGLWIDGNNIEIPPPHVVKKGLSAITAFLKMPEPNQLGNKANSRLFKHGGESLLQKRMLASRWNTVRDTFKPGLASKVVGVFRNKKPEEMKVKARLQRHGQAVKWVRFHSSFSLIATCGVDEVIKLWEPNEFSESQEWTCSHTLRGHKDTIYSCAFSPAHQPVVMASASRDKTVFLWVPHQEAGQHATWTCGQVLGGRLGQGEVKDGKKQHTGAVRVVEFFHDMHQTGKVMLASGGEDDTVRIWSPKERTGDEAWRERENAIQRKEGEKVTRDESHYNDSEMLPIHDLFQQCSAGMAQQLEVEEQVVVTDKKGRKWLERRMGNVGRRANSMDLHEFMQCSDLLGLSEWVNKSTITRLFREVNRHTKSDDEVHELDFVEFCELLYWLARKAQRQTDGEEVIEGPLTWNRYGNMESVLGVKVERLHKFEEDNLEEDDLTKREMGWDCMFTLRGHGGPVSSLAWLPTEDVVLASGSGDESVMLWHYTEFRGRGTWTNVFKGVGHDAIVHRLSVGRGRDRVYLASSSADNSIMLWKISVRPIMRETLDGKVVGDAYSLIKGDRITPGVEAVFTCCQFRSDGVVLVTGLSDGQLFFWKENEDHMWHCTQKMLIHTAPISCVCFGGRQHSTLLITGSDDCKCCLIDTTPFAAFSKRKSRRGSTSSSRRGSLVDTPQPAADVELPPRTESQAFQKRLAAAWTLKMDFQAVQRISTRLNESVAKKELLLTPNHGGTLSMRCQAGSSVHDIRLMFEPNTVWFRTRFRVQAVNVESMEARRFENMHVVGPVVSMTPTGTMFRKPVKVAIPHHAASTLGLVLLQCPFPTDSTCNWTPTDDVEFSATHAHVELESFTCFFLVVHRGSTVPDDVVFCIPQTTDGRPLQHLHVSAGEHWLGQIEIVACASVQRSTAVSECFQGDLGTAPMHALARGTELAHLTTHAFKGHKKFVVNSHCIAPALWTGTHALVPIEIRVTPGSPHDDPDSEGLSPLLPGQQQEWPDADRSATLPSRTSSSSTVPDRLLNTSVESFLSDQSQERVWTSGDLFTLEEVAPDGETNVLELEPRGADLPSALTPNTSMSLDTSELDESLSVAKSDLALQARTSPTIGSLLGAREREARLSTSPGKQLPRLGSSLSRRPLTSSLPNLNMKQEAAPVRTAEAAEETMYVGMALRSSSMEVLAMLTPFRLSILPQRLSVVLHPMSVPSRAASSSSRGPSPPPRVDVSALTSISPSKQLPPPAVATQPLHSLSRSSSPPPPGLLFQSIAPRHSVSSAHQGRGDRADSSKPHDRQVTVAVEVEDSATGGEVTLAEVRRRLAKTLKIVGRDPGARWAALAMPTMRFQLETHKIVRKWEEREVLASEQLPAVGMVFVPPGFDDS